MTYAEDLGIRVDSAVNDYVTEVVAAATTEAVAPLQAQIVDLTAARDTAVLERVAAYAARDKALADDAADKAALATATAAITTRDKTIFDLNGQITTLTAKVRELQSIIDAQPATDVVYIDALQLNNPLSIREALTKNGLGKRLGLKPNTLYEDPDYQAAEKTVWNMTTFSGIKGGGKGSTILRIKPGSSTHAGDVPTTGTNPYRLLKNYSGKNQTYSDFSIIGNAGHLSGGPQTKTGTGKLTVADVELIDSALGDYWTPPRETFAWDAWQCDGGAYFYRIFADGKGRAASLIGFNDCTDCYVENSVLQNSPYGMLTWWQCNTIKTVDVQQLGGHHGFNHERNTGTITHIRPTWIVDRVASPKGMHMTLNSDTGTSGAVYIEDPTVDKGLAGYCTMVQTGKLYRGVPNKQTAVPRIVKAGKPLVMRDYGSTDPRPATFNPDADFYMYR